MSGNVNTLCLLHHARNWEFAIVMGMLSISACGKMGSYVSRITFLRFTQGCGPITVAYLLTVVARPCAAN